MITTKDLPKDNFKLIAACQVSGISNIDIVDLKKRRKSFTIAHSKLAQKLDHLKVKLSQDGS